MENTQKQPFYIFLDFDGVSNDFEGADNIFKFGGLFVSENDKRTFNPYSIEALNYLIETLQQEYECKLVLSTTWRHFFDKAKHILKNNGLEYLGVIGKTPYMFLKKRAYEIMEYLQVKNENENFVVIDDKQHLPKFFKGKNGIKTNILNGALNMSTVLNYLDINFEPLAHKNNLKDHYGFEEDLNKIK